MKTGSGSATLVLIITMMLLVASYPTSPTVYAHPHQGIHQRFSTNIQMTFSDLKENDLKTLFFYLKNGV